MNTRFVIELEAGDVLPLERARGVRVACLDAAKFRPRLLPPSLLDLRAEPVPARTPPTQESA